MQLLNEHLGIKNPFAIAKIESSLSIRKSIETGIQLKKMGEIFGHENTLLLLTRLIENTVSFFNVNNNLSGNQTVQIALVIIERFGHDNIQDIVLALKDARMGFCEKVYGRIDGEIIINWIVAYMEKKADELEKMHKSQKVTLNEISTDILEVVKNATNQKKEVEKKTSFSDQIWLNWFDENKEFLTKSELKSIKTDLEYNNIFMDGIYENTINWIENRLKQ